MRLISLIVSLLACIITFTHPIIAKTGKQSLLDNSRPLTYDGKLTAIERAMPAVVSLYIDQEPNPFGVEHSDHYTQRMPPSRSLGSGFFVSGNGMIVTNAHVVRHALTIRAVLHDGRERKAIVKGIDDATDLALIQVPLENTPYLDLASTQPHVGDQVYAIGNAFGQPDSVTSGIVSALHRAPMANAIEDFIQTDTAINMGNSGGPLINQKGQLIGVNTMIIGIGGGNNGVGFAIPTYLVKNITEQLAQFSSISPSKLGVGIQDMSTGLAKLLNGNPKGTLITQIFPNSPAERAKLQAKDIIIGIDKERITHSSQLRAMVYSQRSGTDLTLHVLRDGKEFETTVSTLDPQQLKEQELKTAPTYLFSGVTLVQHEHINADGRILDGLRVVDVKEGSMAWLSGMIPGDIIVKVDSEAVTEMKQLTNERYQKPETHLVEVQRMGAPLFLALSIE